MMNIGGWKDMLSHSLQYGWQHFFSSVTNTKIFIITVITLIVVLSLFIYQNFALGIYPSSKDSAFETLPYYAKINNLAKAGDSILLVSDMKNFEAYELEYLLKHRYADKKYNLFLIDMPGRNRSFFGLYLYAYYT